MINDIIKSENCVVMIRFIIKEDVYVKRKS